MNCFIDDVEVDAVSLEFSRRTSPERRSCFSHCPGMQDTVPLDSASLGVYLSEGAFLSVIRALGVLARSRRIQNTKKNVLDFSSFWVGAIVESVLFIPQSLILFLPGTSRLKNLYQELFSIPVTMLDFYLSLVHSHDTTHKTRQRDWQSI